MSERNFKVHNGITVGNSVLVSLANGSIGIGTASPGTTLQLNSTAPVIRIVDTSTNGFGDIQVNDAGSIVISADPDDSQSGSAVNILVDGTQEIGINQFGDLTISNGYVYLGLGQRVVLDDDNDTYMDSNIDDNMRMVVAGVNVMQLSSTEANAQPMTGAWRIPNGTTAQRPTGAVGKLRYNTTDSVPEIYTSDWFEIMTTDTTLKVYDSANTQLFP